MVYVATGLVTVSVLLALAAVTPRRWGKLAPSENCQFTVYVTGDKLHTNFIVPAQNPFVDWQQLINLTPEQPDRQYTYLQFGWGDRIFYVETPSWDQVSLASALRSLVLQNPAALYVRGHTQVPHLAGETLKCVRLGPKDYRALSEFLAAGFARDEAGNPQRLKGEHLGAGQFYAATGRYSMLRTCNSWIADGLRAANVNTPIWAGLAPAVLHQLRNGCDCQP